MKANLKFAAVLGFVLLLNFGCEKEDQALYTRFKPEIYDNQVGDFIYVSKTIIKVYESEAAFLFNEEPVIEGVTNENGVYDYPGEMNENYYVYMEKDTLDCLRYGPPAIPKNGRGNPFKVVTAYMSTTPTNLSLTILHQGVPVENATVILYWSEDDYLNNIPIAKRIWEDKNNLIYRGFTINGDFSEKYADEDGMVLFENLEPRPYWFRVKWGGMNNSEGTIKTNGALPDNAFITTSLTVGIN